MMERFEISVTDVGTFPATPQLIIPYEPQSITFHSLGTAAPNNIEFTDNRGRANISGRLIVGSSTESIGYNDRGQNFFFRIQTGGTGPQTVEVLVSTGPQ